MGDMKTHKRHQIAGFILLFAGLLMCSGCFEGLIPKKRVKTGSSGTAQQTTTTAPTSSEKTMLREAEKAQSANRNQEALNKYSAFLEKYPNSTRADSALAAMGQIHENLNQTESAIDTYSELLRKYPQSRYAPEVSHRLSVLLINAGRYDSAADLITKMLNRTTKADKKARLRILLGRAYLGKGNNGQAMDLFRRAYKGTDDPTDREEAANGMKAVIAAMSLDELPQAQTEFGRDFPGGYVSYVLAYRLFEKGRMEEARDQLDFFTNQFAGHDLSMDAQKLRQAFDGEIEPPALTIGKGFGAPKAVEGVVSETEIKPVGPVGDYKSMDIACILPLSGTKRAKYGKRVLKGMELALKYYQAQTPGFKSNLVILDSKGDAATASQLVEQAAANGKVLAAVGPLLSSEAVKAAPKAEELSLPIITITQKTGIPEAGPHVFRLFLTPKAQAEAVAKYAIQILGFSQFAILHPNDTYGKAMRDYFTAEVNSLGGSIVNIEGYDSKSRDFSGNIQRLAGVGKALRRVGAGRKVKVGFEAVFLPDSYRAVAMIAPQFAYHDITTIRFLGTSLWHTPPLLSTVARYTQRCVIPTAYFPVEDRPENQRFLEIYRESVGDSTAEPGQFEAYGFDSTMLLLAMMDRARVSGRDDLVKALNNMDPFSGVTGRFSFSPEGEYQTEPTLITVEGTEFKPIQ